jgi:hypothetical protein
MRWANVEWVQPNVRLKRSGTNARSIGPFPNTWYAIDTPPLRAYWMSLDSTGQVSH